MKTWIVLSFLACIGVTSFIPQSRGAVGDGTGLLGEYFDNPDITAPVFSRLDPNIDFNWGEASPGPGVGPDTFSVRWTGWVKPRYSETYTFYVNSDDGVRVWLNGVLILDNWVDQPPTTVASVPVTLQADNAATLRVHYYDNLYGAVAHLYWSSASQPMEIIPQSRLYPPNLTTNHPPNAPTITEPSVDNELINPSDVHMETAPFSDPDPGDTHVCSDFEIWLVSPSERAWVTSCIGGIEKVHTHLGDGVFENSHAGRTSLFYDTNYKLRIRHRDSSGDPLTEWSAWTERPFRTTSQVNVNTNAPGWILNEPGYNVRVVATGFQLPVNIAFVPNPGTSPGSPFYYVTELYGTIKVVTRDGTVRVYAGNLLNFNPTGNFPGSGEQGLTGIAVEPNTGDVFASMLYDPDGIDGEPHYPKVVRFHSTDGGLTASSQTTILSMPGESQGQSHQISNVSIGSDGKLYVHMGDGFDYTTSMNINSFRGKILRMELDGRPVTTNPFYSAGNGTNAQDYIFAYGFRNPFGGDWRALDGFHYEVENGPNVDRFAKVFSGRNYGFDDTDASMSTFALWNWSPAAAPVNLAFIQQNRFGGSGFPSSKWDHAFVSESGPTWADGPQDRGKRISEFVLSSAGALLSGPTPFLTYNGTGKATVAALAAGPDGLYFSDLYPDQNFTTPLVGGANILRISYGTAVNAPPIVNLYNPTNGEVFVAPANIVLSATPTDDDGIAKVEFYSGGQKVGELMSGPYLFTWGNVPSGNYALTARAMDPSGLWATSKVVNITVTGATNLPPVVTLTAPTNGASFTTPGNVTLSASASDADGIANVEFYASGVKLGQTSSAPFTFTWTNPSAGNYAVSARAMDATGLWATSGVANITVSTPPNLPPVVSLNSPTDGASFTAPVNVTLSATATDADGIATVEFYAGATKLGQTNTPSSTFTWSNTAVGSYALSVRAMDTRGLWGTSAVANITVNAPANPAVLIASRSTWKYLDDGSNLGTIWTPLTYNDAAWRQGPAPLGYGDGDEATVVRSNRTDNTRIITTYYRKTFTVPGTTSYGALYFRLLRDDGAVIYLNGSELYRDNLPGGTLTYTTLALTNVTLGQESSNYVTTVMPSTLLHTGSNVVAVAIHQVLANDPDTSFDLELTGLPAIRLRNPLRAPNNLPTFTVESATGVVCYVELSTDLLTWKPIFTNQPSVTPWVFKDSFTNKTTSFYRARYVR